MNTAGQVIAAELLGRRFQLQTAPGLFSADRIDDGTMLLLAHLPRWSPAAILDLGCGYGALGLPVAARFPDARVTLVDRDMLAVETARANARAAGLHNITCIPSLGYRDLPGQTFDWILCNVPARIGEAAIRYLIGEGATHLKSGGEIRLVVIRDLAATVENVGAGNQWPLERANEGPRHIVYQLQGHIAGTFDEEGVYHLDHVTPGGTEEPLKLERPHDISEAPDHLSEGLPLLLQCLPRRPPQRALVWRGSYGAAAVTLARRGARVTVADRDLLATTYARRNAEAHGVRVTTRDIGWPRQLGEATFDLAVCETSTSAGAESSRRELTEVLDRLSENGTLVWMAQTRDVKDWLPLLTEQHATGAVLASRGRFTVAQLRRAE